VDRPAKAAGYRVIADALPPGDWAAWEALCRQILAELDTCARVIVALEMSLELSLEMMQEESEAAPAGTAAEPVTPGPTEAPPKDRGLTDRP
jgi:hypothetical protein